MRHVIESVLPLSLALIVLTTITGCPADEGVVSQITWDEFIVKRTTCTGQSVGQARFWWWGMNSEPVGASADLLAKQEAYRACVVKATDCTSFLACSTSYTSNTCEPESDGTTGLSGLGTLMACVDDDLMRGCESLPNGLAYQTEMRCSDSRSDTTCMNGYCTLGACEESDPWCDGDDQVICQDGLALPISCEWSGGGCADGECVPTGPPCEQSYCDGDIGVSCHEELGVEVGRSNCSLIHPDVTCVESDLDNVALTANCAPASGESECSGALNPSCDGDLLTSCMVGKTIAADCSSFLGGTCVDDEGTVRCKSPDWP